MGLLQRLASVGLGRRDEQEEEREMPAATAGAASRAACSRARAAADAASVPAAARTSTRPEPVSDYAKRPSHQGLDPLGRQAPVHNSPEDDQLEIPAFLRRQAT